VDLNTIWLTTRKDQTTSDQWLYFAWQRDSNSGSGFISIEFQQSGLPTGCVYTGVDFANKNDPETAALIASCNPWRGRRTGDFIIMWDQQGNTLDAQRDIKKRVYTCTGASAPFACTLGGIEDLGSVVAAVSSDRFRGEMAINLSTDVFDPNAGCQTFANVIPGTVTGNSDTADYKDTVFSAFPPITNCGVLTVKKVTVGPNGNALPDATTVFSYKVNRANAADPVRFAADAADHPLDGPAGFAQFEILRPNASTGAPGIKDGETQTHTDLIAGTNYKLVELNIPVTYKLKSIKCADGSSQTPKDITLGGTFQVVVASAGEQTDCVITNEFLPVTPDLATTQAYTVSLSDSVTISNMQPNAVANRALEVTFKLYKDACDSTKPNDNVVATKVVALTYNAQGTSATATTDPVTVSVTSGTQHTFYWRVFYPGDANGLNTANETPCNLETTQVKITQSDSGS
jgi:hypothetical protein